MTVKGWKGPGCALFQSTQRANRHNLYLQIIMSSSVVALANIGIHCSSYLWAEMQQAFQRGVRPLQKQQRLMVPARFVLPILCLTIINICLAAFYSNRADCVNTWNESIFPVSQRSKLLLPILPLHAAGISIFSKYSWPFTRNWFLGIGGIV